VTDTGTSPLLSWFEFFINNHLSVNPNITESKIDRSYLIYVPWTRNMFQSKEKKCRGVIMSVSRKA
jgi:hypothetical protein